MNRVRFTSNLSNNDIKMFLSIHGNMNGCTVLKRIQYKNEVIYYIKWNENEYVMRCSDFSMKLLKMYDNVEGKVAMIRPDENDWLCFLRCRFKIKYQKYYARAFNAESIIFNEPAYISRISFDEFVILIKNILSYEKKVNISSLEIIETDSFFQSERRFFISGGNLEKPFYMRVSDYQVICPIRSFSYKFRIVMENMFGKKYMDSYSDSFKNIVNPNLTVREFQPKEAMA